MARLLMTRICVCMCVCVYVCEKEGCHVAFPPPLVHYVERRAGGWAGHLGRMGETEQHMI